MKNRKGQALIEFVIILPVIILFIFSFIDLGRIILENNRLENLTNVVLNKYEEVDDYNLVLSHLKSLGYDDVKLSIKKEDNYMTINLSRKIEITTPGLDVILGDPYEVEIERVVNYEK